MRKEINQSSSCVVQHDDPFQIVKNYRDIQLKKRRKLLRKLNKAKKITLRRGYLLNLNFQQKPTERPPAVKIQYNFEEEFNMFFEESANLPQEENYMKTNFFTYDFDLKEESDLFSTSTIESEKSTLYVQEFAQFEFNPIL